MKPMVLVQYSQDPVTSTHLNAHDFGLYRIYLRSILVMTPYLRLFLPRCLFPSGFLTKTQDAFLFSSLRAKRSVRFILLNDHPNSISAW
jgi:hypothetical protein